jgi:ABC-type phosphate/phosphonate transport system substrate-binding protein
VKSYLGVVPGSGIHSLADLKGKRVAVFRGTANQLSFASALASQGLSERELKVINLDFNAANAALAAKQIDATWGCPTCCRCASAAWSNCRSTPATSKAPAAPRRCCWVPATSSASTPSWCSAWSMPSCRR